jgi:hypothetical protein
MELFQQALSALLPKHWLEFFEVVEIIEKKKEWNIVLMEKNNCIPAPLMEKDVVLNGYLNPVEIYDFPIRGKPAYLKFIRRRWKEKGKKTESYFNEYNFHPKGMKATEEFGDFLKGFSRRETNMLLGDIPIYENTSRKDTSLVQKCFKWLYPGRRAKKASSA